MQERGKVRGDVTVRDHYELNGMVTGQIVVEAGGSLVLRGRCRRLRVVQGGAAIIHGIVGEDVINDGGHVEVYGVIGGQLVEKGGTTIVDEDAVIGRD